MAICLYIDYENPGVPQIFDDAQRPTLDKSRSDGFTLTLGEMCEMVDQGVADIFRAENGPKAPILYQAVVENDDEGNFSIAEWRRISL